VLLCELLDGAGNRMSGRCVQRRSPRSLPQHVSGLNGDGDL